MEGDLDKHEPLLESSGMSGEKLLSKYSINKSNKVSGCYSYLIIVY